MRFTVRAFRGADSHQVKILNREELPQPVRAAFLEAVDAGQFFLRPGFAQDAEDFQFDFTEQTESQEEAQPPPSLFRRCQVCGRVALHTTDPAHGCDDCV